MSEEHDAIYLLRDLLGFTLYGQAERGDGTKDSTSALCTTDDIVRAFDTLTAERDALKVRVAEEIDRGDKWLAERDAAREERDSQQRVAIAEMARRVEADRNREAAENALREQVMKTSQLREAEAGCHGTLLQLRADHDRLAACVERVRAVQQYRPIGYADCDVVGKDDMAEFSDRTVLVRYRDILAAMEGA
jgi:hypothetical protein